MYTDMDQWADIRRRVLIDGESKRSVQRRYKIHWKTLQKILNQPEPPGYRQSQPRAKKKLGPFLPVIEEILRQDQQAPAKQRHTAKRIFERLRDEHGYAGGLSRNNADWYRLLELCALFDTLIADVDGIYNPRDFNDRLLLGLKGTLSEAELHSLRLRLDAGRLSKARRGELVHHLPTGLVRDPDGTVRFDPD